VGLKKTHVKKQTGGGTPVKKKKWRAKAQNERSKGASSRADRESIKPFGTNLDTTKKESKNKGGIRQPKGPSKAASQVFVEASLREGKTKPGTHKKKGRRS